MNGITFQKKTDRNTNQAKNMREQKAAAGGGVNGKSKGGEERVARLSGNRKKKQNAEELDRKKKTCVFFPLAVFLFSLSLLPLPHVDPGPQDLVHQQQLRRHDGRRLQHLPLDARVVPDPGQRRVEGAAAGDVDADRGRRRRRGLFSSIVVAVVPGEAPLVLDGEDRLDADVPGVLGQGLRDGKQRLGEGGDAELCPADRLGAAELADVRRGGDLEGPGPGDERAVVDGVFDGAEAVPEGVLDLICFFLKKERN